MSTPRAGDSPLTRDTRGELAVEYLILVAFVGIVVAAGIVAIGFPMLHHYRVMQLILASPAV